MDAIEIFLSIWYAPPTLSPPLYSKKSAYYYLPFAPLLQMLCFDKKSKMTP